MCCHIFPVFFFSPVPTGFILFLPLGFETDCVALLFLPWVEVYKKHVLETPPGFFRFLPRVSVTYGYE